MKIAIIGGGAAGIMCAATLAEKNDKHEVHIFEKNSKLGMKVSISGGGRCNVTTGIQDKTILAKKYIRGSNFLSPALAAFGPKAVMDWFESHNVPLKIEEDLRVFPESNNSEDVIDVFYDIFKKHNVILHFQEGVTQILQNKEKFTIQTKLENYEFDVLVLTTGGNAYSQTGSTGEGYVFAKNLGHTITTLGPSLNSFLTEEKWCKELLGISFKNSKFVTTTDEGKKVEATGPMIFTHFGISGPTTFALAAHLAFDTINPKHSKVVSFIPKAELDFNYWNESFQKQIANFPLKQIHNILTLELPSRFATKILELANILPERKANSITREERIKLAKLLAGELKLTLTMRKVGDEFVTAGGINSNEVDRKTMRSKLNPNLYFAGEILDVDGLTGGFNLQAAWCTGRLVGMNF